MTVATRIWTSTVVVPAEVLGDHRFTSGLEPAEDRDLWVQLIAANPVYVISDPLATAVLEPGRFPGPVSTPTSRTCSA